MGSQYFGRLGVGVKLALVAVAMSIPLVAVAITTYRSNTSERRSAEAASALLIAQSVAATVEGFNTDLESLTLAVAQALGRQTDPIDQASAGSYLASASSLHTSLQGFLLTDLRGRVIASKSGTGLGLDLSDRPYILALQAGADSVWTDSVAGVRSGRTVVAFARVVRALDGSARAYLLAAFYPDQVFERLPVRLPADAAITLIDDRGGVLYSSYRGVVSPESQTVLDAPGVSAAINGQVIPLMAQESPFPGEPSFGALVPVTRSRWVVAFTRPQAALESALSQGFLYQVAGIMLTTLLAAIVTILVARRLTQPLTVLAERSQAIARGERAEIPVALADPEMNRLAEAMRTMENAVSEREQALQEQREWLQVTLSSIGDAVVVADPVGRITFINAVAQRLTGWSEQEALGSMFDEVIQLIDEETRQTSPNPTVRVLEGGTIVGLEDHTLLIARDGTELPIDDTASPIRDSKGVILGVVMVFREIADRRRAEVVERFLARASELLATSLDYETTLRQITRLAVPSVADFCILDVMGADGSDMRTVVAHVDPERDEMLREMRRRYPPGQTVSLVVSQVLHSGHPQLYPEFHDSLLSAISQDPEHYQLLRKIGIRSLMSVPLVARGRTLGAMSFFTGEAGRRFADSDLLLAQELARRCALAIDNSSLYQAEQQARGDAQSALTQRDELTSLVTHDLKNPLTALKATVQLMRRRGEYDNHAVERILLQVDYLHRLIDDLAAFATLQSGRLELRPGVTDLMEVVQPIVLQHTLQNETHELRIEAAEDSISGVWDRDRLEQVLRNLVGNAVKYSPEGGEVLLQLEKQDGEVQVSIRDQGLGIPQSELPHVFNRFYRTDSAAQTASGLGLGLYISRSLVEAHGGKIWAESQGPGYGSTFCFTLPLTS